MEKLGVLVLIVYEVIATITFVYLTFFDGYVYTWWNWLIALPCNGILAEIWPLYWGIIRWVPSPF